MNSPGQDVGGQPSLGTVPQPASQEEITNSPLWHLFDYDLSTHTFVLMRIEEQLYREASFLDQRIASYQCPSVRYELQHMARMFPPLGEKRGSMGFIFHVGHCGSTLLSRALSVSPEVLPFREPMSLRTLSGHQRELDTPQSFLARPDWEWLVKTIVDSLARRFHPGQLNIVKATSTGNNLIAPILAGDESHRALLLYVPLESYLATMLGKRKQGGDLWGQAQTRMKDWMEFEAEPSFALHQLRAPQFAVLSWITSMNFIIRAQETFGERVKLMNFEDLITRPDDCLPATAAHFGIESQSDLIVEGFSEVSSGYSKRPGKRYTPDTRMQLLQITRTEHGDDIRSGLDWARTLLDNTPGLAPCGQYID